ncbi:MAG: hypothetical protein FJZ11_02240 [Candidatus Omnitrophica bacterium]|nr:hypothetical protein [Candidatus Omnitrophota bacterium]
MKRFFLFLVLLLVFLAISASFYFRNINAQEATPSGEDNKIMEKIDKIIQSQKEIFQKLDGLEQELKARCHR